MSQGDRPVTMGDLIKVMDERDAAQWSRNQWRFGAIALILYAVIATAFLAWQHIAFMRNHENTLDAQRKVHELINRLEEERYEGFMRLAAYCARHRQYDDAIQNANEASKFKPDRHEHWTLIGDAQVGLQRRNEAIEAYAEALARLRERDEDMPVRLGLLMRRGVILNDARRWAEAEQDFTDALHISERVKGWDRGYFFFHRGVAREKLGKLQEAIKDFKSAEAMGYADGAREHLKAIEDRQEEERRKP